MCGAPFVLAFGLIVSAATAQSSAHAAAYEKERRAELAEIGKRHAMYGLALRKSGLVPQATFQFVRAVELSEGNYPYANTVLGLMRGLGELFWREKRKHTSKASLLQYQKKAGRLEVDDQKSHQKLAKLAQRAELQDRVREHWLMALRLGAELEITGSGEDRKARIGGDKVDPDYLEWLAGLTIEVDGQTRFDAGGAEVAARPAAAKAPQLEGFREASNDRIVVRTDLDFAVAADLAALGEALFEPLQERLEGMPVKALQLIVFARRADYEAYLTARGHGDAIAARGLCDYGGYQTLLCAEGLAPEDLHALALHELTHLYFWGSSPVAMPDFFAEGLAETFGGQGTFTWDGKTLTTGGPMRPDRVAAVKAAMLPLADLMAIDALRLIATDHDRAMLFYAQSQLLLRFLRQSDKWSARLQWWEDECRGKLDGTQSTVRVGSSAPAQAAFQRLFGGDLAAIEREFAIWLEDQ
ncbi:MAG: hypothetical protein KDE27_24215 [Planctomycetes bacterium]|nr:hypothetical protein [Planctomycetota bacterium]